MHENLLKGAIYGFAYGDAWGKDAEFKTHKQIIKDSEPFPNPALVTDDTQMSLYSVGAVMYEAAMNPEALKGLHYNEKKRNAVRVLFADSFVEFAEDPDNNRAPGTTCMSALKSYKQFKRLSNDGTEMTGMEGVIADSKGCGANMRSGWLGLLPLQEEDIINLAILQSETTHGHPLALASSVLTALTLRAIISGEIVPRQGHYYDWALNKISDLEGRVFLFRNNSAGEWNPDYGKGLTLLGEFLKSKKDQVISFAESEPTDDICSFFGEGWVAEEAYLCALMGADYSPLDPVEGLERLVWSNGDSDSLAAIGGQFIGAFDGFQVFPEEWEKMLEPRYQEELEEVVEFFVRVNS
jgi:ADP-ribosylglycohydrolase